MNIYIKIVLIFVFIHTIYCVNVEKLHLKTRDASLHIGKKYKPKMIEVGIHKHKYNIDAKVWTDKGVCEQKRGGIGTRNKEPANGYHPIVVIPGLGGSVLFKDKHKKIEYARQFDNLKEWYPKAGDKESEAEEMPNKVDEATVIDDLKLEKDWVTTKHPDAREKIVWKIPLTENDYFSEKSFLHVKTAFPTHFDFSEDNPEGVYCNVYANHYEQPGIAGIDVLTRMLDSLHSNGLQFEKYFDALQKKDFELGVHLVGAPYDFRFAPYATKLDHLTRSEIREQCRKSEEISLWPHSRQLAQPKKIVHYKATGLDPKSIPCIESSKKKLLHPHKKIKFSEFIKGIPTFKEEEILAHHLKTQPNGGDVKFQHYEWTKFYNKIVAFKCGEFTEPRLTNCHFLQILFLIKKMYWANGGIQVQVVAHSNGNNVFKHLLENVDNLDKYVQVYAAVASPMAGAGKILNNLGNGEGISLVVSSEWMKEVSFTWPNQLWLMPKKGYAKKAIPAARYKGKNYYTDWEGKPNILQFMKDFEFPHNDRRPEVASKIIGEEVLLPKTSKVSTTKIILQNIYGDNLSYNTKLFVDFDDKKNLYTGSGDGTVPQSSLVRWNDLWSDYQTEPYVINEKTYGDHCTMLLQKKMINFLVDINTGVDDVEKRCDLPQ